MFCIREKLLSWNQLSLAIKQICLCFVRLWSTSSVSGLGIFEESQSNPEVCTFYYLLDQLLFLIVLCLLLLTWSALFRQEENISVIQFSDCGRDSSDAETCRWRLSEALNPVCCISTLSLCLLSVWLCMLVECVLWLCASMAAYLSLSICFFISLSLPTVLFVTCSDSLSCLIWFPPFLFLIHFKMNWSLI